MNELPDPALCRRIDAAMEKWAATVFGPVFHTIPGAALAFIAQRVTEEMGVVVIVTWTPDGIRGYPLPTAPSGAAR